MTDKRPERLNWDFLYEHCEEEVRKIMDDFKEAGEKGLPPPRVGLPPQYWDEDKRRFRLFKEAEEA